MWKDADENGAQDGDGASDEGPERGQFAPDDEGDDDTSFMLILDEIERFKNLIINKYKNYIEEKEYEILLKKLEILKAEIEHRRSFILEKSLEYEISKKGKSSR